jgi:hypothetical protein
MNRSDDTKSERVQPTAALRAFIDAVIVPALVERFILDHERTAREYTRRDFPLTGSTV